ncbi:hypothetical protein Dda_4746 [Drechslerella dactyloides]|uniref:Uncharacterized protein n=1 Tax=Drechslerella dactyloides TaxID=74499 RepID=A0AAD6IZQ3_DREDA|nr:hypothetical protein Dda_4746 [Drechslerella dactyloides]
MDVPEMEGLSRAWPASNRVIESTASLLGAINSLCLHYLLVRSSDKKEVLEDLNRLIIRHYDYLPESIRGMRAEVIPEDLYMVAVTTEDRNCIEALRGILRCDGKWIPEIKHFEAAVCNETAAYDVFELLRERATKYNAKIFESSVIWKAVEIESKNSYIIFHHILGLVKDADLYGDFNIDGLEDFIKKHKKGEAKDLLLSVFEAWKTERESGRREVNKMIELGCGFDDEEEFAKWET